MEDEKLQRAEVFVHAGGRHCGTKWTITNRRIFLLLPLPPPHIKHERVAGALLGRREEESHGDGVFVTTIFSCFGPCDVRARGWTLEPVLFFAYAAAATTALEESRANCDTQDKEYFFVRNSPSPLLFQESETFLCNVHTLATIRFRKRAWLEPFSPSEPPIP